MCGITAILLDPASPVDPATIDRMTASLIHRGPDDQQTAHLVGCDFGHTRLSILDLAGGTQPMSDATGRWTIIFNGEIYNHADLRRELIHRGIHFRTRSDTEVLLQAFIEFGPACLNRLNGQFAFAVWDRDRQELFAARDRFGEKPLYWARSPQGHVLLASEIKAIEASELVSPRINPLSVDLYLGLYYVPPDRTIYSNIRTLLPGHAIVWQRGEGAVCDDVRAYCWWSPRVSHLKIDREDAVMEIRRLLGNAVRRQMVADVPVGAFLSGGLDSSSIVALMADQAAGQAKTFAAGFGELIDELPYAREVATLYDTHHRESQVDRIDVAAELAAMAAIYDEPFGDSSNIPTSIISRQARQQVKVVLSGDGGDELFGGYAWYEPAIESLGRLRQGDVFADHVGRTGPIGADRAALWGHRSQPASLESLRQRFASRNCWAMNVATQFDVSCYLAGDILVKVDRAAMANGLETRAPFLDAELADFVLSLPWQMRFGVQPSADCASVGGGRTADRLIGAVSQCDGPQCGPYKGQSALMNDRLPLKSLLREACGSLWPASIRERNKQGFGAPVKQWLLRPEVDDVWRRVTQADGALAALLPGVSDAAVTDAIRPQRKWSLLCLGVWLQGREACLAGLS